MSADFIKITVIILLSLGLCVLIKSYRPEYAFLLSVCVSLVIITLILSRVFPQIKTIERMYYESSGNRSNFGILIKALIISYISGFCGDTCRDFGQTALAEKAEFAGRCAIFVLSVPLLVSVFETAIGFMNV